MSIKIVRIIAALAFITSIIGSTRVAKANRAAPLELSAKSSEAMLAPKLIPLNIPALTETPVSSLGVQFVHFATAANIDGHTTLIDNPLTNGDPLAIILVTMNKTPGGVNEPDNSHYIGVFYNYNVSQWGIYNENGDPMMAGTTFNVIVPPAGANASVQFATTNSNAITINNPLTDNKPNAIIYVTPIWNPGGGVSGHDANFPVSVLYNDIINQWTIFDQSGAIIPNGTAFNVFVLPSSAGIFVHTTKTEGTGGIYTLIDNPLTNGHPNAIVFASPHFISGGHLNESPIGVLYDNGYWKIYNRYGGDMPLNTSFNVLVLVPHSDIFVHTATSGNKSGNYSMIDNALTNSNPNAIIFTTSNLTPGGVGESFYNINTGVIYNGSAWCIFDENVLSSIPNNSSFNVLAPDPDASVFLHTARITDITGDHTAIDYPLTNGNPNAILLVTQNVNPGGVLGSNNNHPIGVEYFADKWWIFNQDGATMLPGTSFNVFVPSVSPGVDVFVHTATTENSNLNYTNFSNPHSDNNPNAIILTTPNLDPGGLCPCLNLDFPIGVGFIYGWSGGRWAIFNQNGLSSPIPIGASFNVYVFSNDNKVYLPMIIR